MKPTESSLLDQLIDPVARCFTPEVAGQIANLRASAAVQDRLDVLSDLCTEGALSEEERTEYDTYVNFIDFIAILQAKARAILSVGSTH